MDRVMLFLFLHVASAMLSLAKISHIVQTFDCQHLSYFTSQSLRRVVATSWWWC